MIVCQPSARRGSLARKSGAALYAAMLEDFYRGLLDQPLSDRLGRLVWKLRQGDGECSTPISRR